MTSTVNGCGLNLITKAPLSGLWHVFQRMSRDAASMMTIFTQRRFPHYGSSVRGIGTDALRIIWLSGQ